MAEADELIARILLRCRPTNTARRPLDVLKCWSLTDLRTLAEGLDNGMARQTLTATPRPLWPNLRSEGDD